MTTLLRGRVLTLAAALFLLPLFGATADAAAIKAPKVTVSPASGPPGTTFVITFTRGSGAKCKLVVRQGWASGKRVLSASIRRKGGYAFRVKEAGKAGSRQVSVQCGGRRGQAFFDVTAPVSKDTPVAPQTGTGDQDPFGEEALSQAEIDKLPALEAVGGEGASTRMPFARGAAYKVTQSRNGGTSHTRATTYNAVDLAVPLGTPLLAGVSGTIVRAAGGCPQTRLDTCGGGFGNYIQLRASDGTCYIYAHLSSIDVPQGAVVDRYRQVAKSGTSGYSTGPHLHIDRRDCTSGVSLAWTFDENSAGPPRVGATLVSANEPPAPVATPVPTPAATPAPGGGPAPTPAPAPRRVITVDNRVTNGGGMREDPTPARLTTKPWIYCGTRGCNIGGTERTSGGTYDAAVCQTSGERTTNGNDSSAADDGNPERFESTRYYGVRLGDGTFGLISEVWIRAADRGGLGLPGC